MSFQVCHVRRSQFLTKPCWPSVAVNWLRFAICSFVLGTTKPRTVQNVGPKLVVNLILLDRYLPLETTDINAEIGRMAPQQSPRRRDPWRSMTIVKTESHDRPVSSWHEGRSSVPGKPPLTRQSVTKNRPPSSVRRKPRPLPLFRAEPGYSNSDSNNNNIVSASPLDGDDEHSLPYAEITFLEYEIQQLIDASHAEIEHRLREGPKFPLSETVQKHIRLTTPPVSPRSPFSSPHSPGRFKKRSGVNIDRAADVNELPETMALRGLLQKQVYE